jgi:tRNA threonylcarbamoyladenosine modification (KEOPS) complex  Pcc1 subunit
MTESSIWRGTIVVHRPDATGAERLLQALAPEAAREVPRAHATVTRGTDDTVRVTLVARDTGSVRAAVNTYLGWISLAERTETAARPLPKHAPR